MIESKLDERTCELLKKLIDEYWEEDRAVRERQIRKWRHLKLLWDGFSRVWWSDTAHDWRVYDENNVGDGQQDYYDKPINVLRAYLETIIAALSVLVPPIKCYPDDADNNLDLMTAKAADKIGQLIYRHNNVNLLWLQSLFIYTTEGMCACYNYSKESKEYGTYEENEYDSKEEMHEISSCSICGMELSDEVTDEFQPDDTSVVQQELQMCPECMEQMVPDVKRESLTITRLIGVTKHPKSRQCLEVYGGLYIKVPNYAKKQADCPYLFFSYETNYALARARFSDIREKIQPNSGTGIEEYERWGRQNPNYQGEYPDSNVTIRNAWFRPASFECLTADEADELRERFPDGVRVSSVNDFIAEYENESLDDHWTLTENPLSDFLYFDPLGAALVSTQEITNDTISLTQQTIEHGIPQTFADQNVLDFKAYGQTEATPGGIFPATARAGKSVGEGFYEVKTATLSQEVLPFLQMIQSMGQLAVGAQPSLFGGDMQGSKTASEYSMSRAQALQRLQNTWKMQTSWWKNVFAKVIPQYIADMRDDEKFVEADQSGSYINVLIKRAELEGKLGNFELESNENLPITWSQKKDAIMALMEANNPAIPAMIMTAENLPLIYEMIGVPDFVVPGEDARNKQYAEIKELLITEPVVQPLTEEEMFAAQSVGQEPTPLEEPSVPVEEFDNHQVELEICIKWINSDAGQLAKLENPPGYKNVILHARMHKQAMMQEMMEQMAAQGSAPLENSKEDTKAPKDVENVPVNN